MINPEPRLNPFLNVRETKPWVLDRIIHPRSRYDLHIKPPPLIPRIFTRQMILRMPIFLLGTCLFLYLWQSNPFGIGLATDNSTPSCPTSSTPQTPQTGNAPSPSLVTPTPAARLTSSPGSPAKPTTSPSSPNPAASTYEVKAGDSLWTIGVKFKVTVDELRAANNLTGNLLHVGDRLVIPQKAQ